MNAIKNEEYYDKLKNRRGEIMRTLEHVQKEQRTVRLKLKEWIVRSMKIKCSRNSFRVGLDPFTKMDRCSET